MRPTAAYICLLIVALLYSVCSALVKRLHSAGFPSNVTIVSPQRPEHSAVAYPIAVTPFDKLRACMEKLMISRRDSTTFKSQILLFFFPL